MGLLALKAGVSEVGFLSSGPLWALAFAFVGRSEFEGDD